MVAVVMVNITGIAIIVVDGRRAYVVARVGGGGVG